MNGENSSVFRRSSTLKELPVVASKVLGSKRITNRPFRSVLLSSSVLVLVLLLGLEIKSSWLESRVLAAIAGKLTFSLEQGASDAIQYSSTGPYDERLGYSRLPNFLAQLESSGFRLESQARESKMYLLLAKLHIYPVYKEKGQAGLEILDRDSKPFYTSRYPSRVYEDFSEIPPVIVSTVMFVENRDILDANHPYLPDHQFDDERGSCSARSTRSALKAIAPMIVKINCPVAVLTSMPRPRI